MLTVYCVIMIFLKSFFLFLEYTMSNSFGKKDRLKGKRVVSKIFEGPKKSISLFPFKAFYSISSSNQSQSKFGVSVPKKKFKRAVDRNKIKRRVREAYRLNKDPLVSLSKKYAFGFVYTPKKILPFKEIETKLKDSILRLEKELD